jgi:hypothetical protein
VRTVWVPVVANGTREQGIEAELTEALIAELGTDGSLRPVQRGKADCELRASIVSYRRDMLQKNPQGLPISRNVKVSARVRLLRPDGVPLTDEMTVSSADTDPTAGYVHGDEGESETLGRHSAIRGLARSIVRALVEPW